MATLLQDNFDRANSTTVIGSPQVGPAPTVLSGVGGITGNQLYAPTPTLLAVYDLATVNVELSAQAVGTSSTARMGFIFGVASATDHYLVQFMDTGVWVYKSNPGGYSDVLRTNPPVPAALTNVRAAHYNQVLYAFVNDTQVLRYPLDAPITNTRHGVRMTSATGIRVDNLLGTDSPAYPDPPAAPAAIPAPGQVAVGDNPFLTPSFAYRGRDNKALDIAGGA